MSKKAKKWLMSSLITFITAFGTVILSQYDALQLSSLTDGVLMGVIFTALRAGVKALLEMYLVK